MSAPARPRFRESSVVVLVRGHGAGLETFWVRRSDAVPVQPGFHAFLGGKVDPQDLELPIEGAPSDFERAARSCAIREAFEEAGVLVGLAPPAGPAAEDPRLEGLDEARARLIEGHVTFPELALQRGWRFDASALEPAGRWTTPPFAAARFDTCYYLARVPAGQSPRVHPGELASGEWVRPLDALDRYRHGGVVFVAPILWTLIALAEGEEGLLERLAHGPERAFTPVPRIEMTWGVVLHPIPTRPLPPATHTNAYLIGEREVALVDPGSDEPDALAALFALIDHLAGEGRRLRMVLLTHHHPDHVAGVAAVRERYRVPVAAHAETGTRVKIDVTLADGERIPLAAGIRPWTLRAIHTPGHTRDHLCFLHEEGGGLFCGDLVSGSGTVVIDPPDGDMADYLASLEKIAALSPRVLFPAHGAPSGAPAGRIRGLVEHRMAREARVLRALTHEPLDLDALVPSAYEDTPKELWKWAERSLLAHLIKLEREGHARREGEKWRTP